MPIKLVLETDEGERITIRTGTPSTAANSVSCDVSTRRVDVDNGGRNDARNAPVNESNAGSSSPHGEESEISKIFGLVKVSHENLSKLTKVLQEKQESFEEKYMKARNFSKKKTTARAKRELWRIFLNIKERCSITQDHLLNGMSTLESEDESDTEDQSSSNGDPPVSSAVEMETDDLPPEEQQRGVTEEPKPGESVKNNEGNSEEVHADERVTPASPIDSLEENGSPNLEVSNITEPLKSTILNVGFESSTTPEIDTPGPSVTQTADETVQRLTDHNELIVSRTMRELSDAFAQCEDTISGNPATSDERETDFTPEIPPNDEVINMNPSSVQSIHSSTKEDESPLPRIDYAGEVSRMEDSDDDEVERLEVRDQEKMETNDSLVDQPSNDDVMDVVPSSVDESAHSITEEDDCSGTASGSTTDQSDNPSSADDFDEEVDSSMYKFGYDGECTNTSSLEVHVGDDDDEVERTIYRFETDASPSNVHDDDEIMESVLDSTPMSAETNLSDDKKNESSRSPVLNDTGFSEVSDINDTSGQSESPVTEYSNGEIDAKSHEIPDEENTFLREDRIVDVNPRSVESVESSAEDNSSPAYPPSPVQEAIRRIDDVDPYGTVAEITAFEPSASSAQENLDAERYEVYDEDERTRMNTLVHEGEIVDVDKTPVESVGLSMDDSISPISHGFTQRTSGEIDDADSSAIVGNFNEEENAGRREIQDEDENTENNALVREDGIVDVSPKSVESVESSAEDNSSPANPPSPVQEAISRIDDADPPGTEAEIEQLASSAQENSDAERCEVHDDDGKTEMNTLIHEGEIVDVNKKPVESVEISMEDSVSPISQGLAQGANGEIDDAVSSVVVGNFNEEENAGRREIHDEDENTEKNALVREDGIVDVNPKSVESVEPSAEETNSPACSPSLVQEAISRIDDAGPPSTVVAEITAFQQSASSVQENLDAERYKVNDDDEKTEMNTLIHEGKIVDVDKESVESVELPMEDSVSPISQDLAQGANGGIDDHDSSAVVENCYEEENAERREIHDEDGIADINPKSIGPVEFSVEETGSPAYQVLTQAEIDGTISEVDEFGQSNADVIEDSRTGVEREVNSIIQSLENDVDGDDEVLPLKESISSSIQESRCPTLPVLESNEETQSPNVNVDQGGEITNEVQPWAESTDLSRERNTPGVGGDVEDVAESSIPVVIDVLAPAVDESDVNCEIDEVTNLSSAAAPVVDVYENMEDCPDYDEVMKSCCSVSNSVRRTPARMNGDIDRPEIISLTIKSQQTRKRQRDDESDDESMIETCNETPKVKRQQLEDGRNDDDAEIFIDRPEKRKRSLSFNSSSDESCSQTRQADKKQKTTSSTSNFIFDEATVSAAVSTVGKGRKNIREIMGDEELGEETREVNRKEEARKEFVKERRALLEQIEGSEIPRKKLILDYCPETKEEVITVHPKIVEKLKPHQAEGIRFMFDAAYESVEKAAAEKGGGCILAHCMGLGKTFQAIALIHTVLSSDKINARTVLVLCPPSIISNWTAEFREWLADVENKNDIPIFDIQAVKGDIARTNLLGNWQSRGGVLILGYQMFKQLVDPPEKNRPAKKYFQQMKAALLNPGPDLVVCDEGHLLKNDTTALSQAATSIKTRRKIVLTGTLLQNDLKEYYSMIQFVKPNLLGTREQFANRFVSPITNGQYKDSKPEDVALMKQRTYILTRKTVVIVQRFDFSILKPYLEPKYEFVISVALSDVQARSYQYYLDNKTSATDSGKAAGLFAHYSALRLLWNHPLALKLHAEKPKPPKNKKANAANAEDEEGAELNMDTRWWRNLISKRDWESSSSGPKLLLLLAILQRCKKVDEKLLVFSPSLPTLDMIEHFLQQTQFGGWKKDKDYYRVDGTVTGNKRTKYFGDFNKPNKTSVRLFLISTTVGGLGLNLTAANRVILFDASWNPSKDTQSVYRVFRLGQKKPCYIYRFVSGGTMEEKIYKRQVTKLSIAGRVVDKQQIERHYLLKNISELYELDRRMPTGEVLEEPNDHVLAELLREYRDTILSYHEHDSLLENKPEEDLTDETKLELDVWQRNEVESVLMLQAPASSGGKKSVAGDKDAESCSTAARLVAPVEADVGSTSAVEPDEGLDLPSRIETESKTNAPSLRHLNDVLLDLSVPTESLSATCDEPKAGFTAVENHCHSLEPIETSSETDVGSVALSVAPMDQDEDMRENSSVQTAVGSVAPSAELEDRDDTFSEPPGETQTWLSETDDGVEPAASSMETEDRDDTSGTDAGPEAPAEIVPDIDAASTDEVPCEKVDDAILQENDGSNDSETDVNVVDHACPANAVESNIEVENTVSFSLLTFGEVDKPAQKILMDEEFIMPSGFGTVEESPFMKLSDSCRWW